MQHNKKINLLILNSYSKTKELYKVGSNCINKKSTLSTFCKFKISHCSCFDTVFGSTLLLVHFWWPSEQTEFPPKKNLQNLPFQLNFEMPSSCEIPTLLGEKQG